MRLSSSLLSVFCCFVLSIAPCIAAQPTPPKTARGDAMIAAYFRQQTAHLRDACLADVKSLRDWQAKRGEYRRQLLEMLGLDPPPPRAALLAKTTGTVDHPEFTVENVHFQSRPGLYVTGNVYVPKNLNGPVPAILYVCGHGRVERDGVSYGNKVHYQHHGAWFARHGYICLTIDTLQLGEIEGIHHGTYRHGMWWWLGRGYTPAGVEAWNCVRALDYLQQRQDVDGKRLGVTGRSGGGAYSWWIAAIDDRIQAAVPVAGITDLQNHVVDGCVEGHCDCMYFVNTFQWDYPLVAALVAPRPLLISNTDRDGIFPLDGVVRTYRRVRRIYELYGAADKLGLQITAGPHKDTQELRVHAFRWMNRHLRGDEELLDKPAVSYFEPPRLKVFRELPSDQKNTEIQESFVAKASPPSIPEDASQWRRMRGQWLADLKSRVFRAWPTSPPAAETRQVFDAAQNGVRLQAFDFVSQDLIKLRLYISERADLKQRDLVVLNVLDEESWREFLASQRVLFEEQLREETLPAADHASFEQHAKMLRTFPWSMAYVAPRGVGPSAWSQDERKQTQIRRRFYLLGQTLDGMRVWDVRRAMQTLRSLPSHAAVPLWLQSQRRMAGVALFAALYEPDLKRLDLHQLPESLREGPYLLNAQRFLDTPQVLAMAAERSRVVLYEADAAKWSYPQEVGQRLGWDAKRFQVRQPASDPCTMDVHAGDGNECQ